MNKIIVSDKVRKQIDSVSSEKAGKINSILSQLAEQKQLPGSQKLSYAVGNVNVLRVDSDTRVVYTIRENNTVEINRISNRRSDRQKEQGNELIISYLALRRLIGLCGFLLPVFLVFATVREQGKITVLPSISDYYYTSRGDFFVVLMSVIGVFLLTYKGYCTRERLWSSLAGICALLVAFNPTAHDKGKPDQIMYCSGIVNTNATKIGGPADTLICTDTVGHCFEQRLAVSVHRPRPVVPRIANRVEWHLTFAGVFLVVLGIISIRFFPRTDKPTAIRVDGKLTKKGKRNILYRWCGWIIIGSIAFLLVYFLTLQKVTWLQNIPVVFIMETVSVWAFAVSWLTKGDAILADDGNYLKTLYHKMLVNLQSA